MINNQKELSISLSICIKELDETPYLNQIKKFEEKNLIKDE